MIFFWKKEIKVPNVRSKKLIHSETFSNELNEKFPNFYCNLLAPVKFKRIGSKFTKLYNYSKLSRDRSCSSSSNPS